MSAIRVDTVIDAVLSELLTALGKFPTWPTDPLHAVAILGEEFGELTRAVMQASYEPHKGGPAEVRAEVLQTAAMAIRFLVGLDAYQYRAGEQQQPLLDWGNRVALSPAVAPAEPSHCESCLPAQVDAVAWDEDGTGLCDRCARAEGWIGHGGGA